MKLEVLDINGKGLGREVELPDNVFGLELNENHEHVVYLAVKQYLAHQRQGTHKSKERAEISGSTRKLYRQKGTGSARKGSIKSPILRGGGRVFGPRPRTYSLKLNKKVSRLARRAALTNKAKENRIVVVEDFQLDAPKTSNYLKFLSSVKAGEGTLADIKSLLMLNAPVAPTAPEAPLKVKARGRKKTAQAELNTAYEAAMKTFEEELKTYESALDAYENEVVNKYENIALSARNIPNADVINAKDLNVYEVMNADYIVLSESAIEQIQEILK